MNRLPPVASALLAAGLSLVACVSSRVEERFHTLLPAPSAASAPASSPPAAAPIYVDLLPVNVPAQVDHAQWVVRQADESLLMLEQDRWAAPLRDELRGAIVERLTSRWGAVDVRSVALPAPAVWRVRVDVQRFESIPSREARLEAAWSLSSSRGASTLVCRSVFSERVDAPGVAALAAAHRQAAERLADTIGARLRALQGGAGAGC